MRECPRFGVGGSVRTQRGSALRQLDFAKPPKPAQPDASLASSGYFRTSTQWTEPHIRTCVQLINLPDSAQLSSFRPLAPDCCTGRRRKCPWPGNSSRMVAMTASLEISSQVGGDCG